MRLLRLGAVLAGRGWSWALDYLYAGFWQVHGHLVRADAGGYLPAPRPETAPVLLIPGIYERWWFMRPLAEHVHRLGHPVHVVEALGYNRGSVVRMAELVSAYLTEHELHRVIIIAHSKGGLIGKYVMTDADIGARVDRMLTINTPFSGSVYARFFLLPSIRAFSPRNKVLRGLTDQRDVNARITSVYSSWDPHIPGGSRLSGARNVQLKASGHFRVMGAAETLSMVEQVLTAPDGRAPDVPQNR